MTDLLGVCTSWGDGVCVIAPGGRRAGHDPARRHRLRQAGAAAAVRRGTGSPRCDAQLHGLAPLAGPGDRAARRLAAALAPPPRPRAGPTRSWRSCRPGVDGRLRAGGRPLRPAGRGGAAGLGRGRAVPRPRLGAGEPRRRHAVPDRERGPGAAGAAGARGLDTLDRRQVELVETVIRGHVRRPPGSATRRAGWRRTPTTGSASAASRWRPQRRRRASALAVMAALLEWGAEQGATTAYLQVLGDNAAGARALRRARVRDPPRLPLPDPALTRPRRSKGIGRGVRGRRTISPAT